MAVNISYIHFNPVPTNCRFPLSLSIKNQGLTDQSKDFIEKAKKSSNDSKDNYSNDADNDDDITNNENKKIAYS